MESRRLQLEISIHSPRKGRDAFSPDGKKPDIADFNPLSPQGERPYMDLVLTVGNEISIHSPRKGRDCAYQKVTYTKEYFNPLSPQGERLG